MYDIKNHSKYRNFKFTLQNNKVVMWYKEGSRNTLWCGYNDTEGLQILRDVIVNSNPEVMLPKEIDEASFKDVYKKKVQNLLYDKDKVWWNDFKSDQAMIHPLEKELEEYDEIWDIEEGEREVPRNNELITIRNKKLKPIIITDHPLSLDDLEIGDLIIVEDNELRIIAEITDIDEDDETNIKIVLWKKNVEKDEIW